MSTQDPWSRFSKEAAARDAYTYSGYTLPMIQLDETGPSYVILPPHPSLYGQPDIWSERAVFYCGWGPINIMQPPSSPTIPLE